MKNEAGLEDQALAVIVSTRLTLSPWAVAEQGLS